jgi:hypothetical protein
VISSASRNMTAPARRRRRTAERFRADARLGESGKSGLFQDDLRHTSILISSLAGSTWNRLPHARKGWRSDHSVRSSESEHFCSGLGPARSECKVLPTRMSIARTTTPSHPTVHCMPLKSGAILCQTSVVILLTLPPLGGSFGLCQKNAARQISFTDQLHHPDV